MAEWLSQPWIEKAINSFHDRNATLPKLARAQIIQFNQVPSSEKRSAEALLSDKWMYAKAIFTPESIEDFQKSTSSASEELNLTDIKGGLIFLKQYKVVPHVNYQKGVWEHVLVVINFTFIGCQKSTQFGSEIINSAAHAPFQVKIKKHFQLKQIAQLYEGNQNNNPEDDYQEEKCLNVFDVSNGILARQQFAFLPEDQEKLLNDIPGWGNIRNEVSMSASSSTNISFPLIARNTNPSKSSTLQSNPNEASSNSSPTDATSVYNPKKNISHSCSNKDIRCILVKDLIKECQQLPSFSDSQLILSGQDTRCSVYQDKCFSGQKATIAEKQIDSRGTLARSTPLFPDRHLLVSGKDARDVVGQKNNQIDSVNQPVLDKVIVSAERRRDSRTEVVDKVTNASNLQSSSSMIRRPTGKMHFDQPKFSSNLVALEYLEQQSSITRRQGTIGSIVDVNYKMESTSTSNRTLDQDKDPRAVSADSVCSFINLKKELHGVKRCIVDKKNDMTLTSTSNRTLDQEKNPRAVSTDSVKRCIVYKKNDTTSTTTSNRTLDQEKDPRAVSIDGVKRCIVDKKNDMTSTNTSNRTLDQDMTNVNVAIGSDNRTIDHLQIETMCSKDDPSSNELSPGTLISNVIEPIDQVTGASAITSKEKHSESSSYSEGSSSIDRKSDESYSILRDVSITDLFPVAFVPEFTSTAKTNVTSAYSGGKETMTSLLNEKDIISTPSSTSKLAVTSHPVAHTNNTINNSSSPNNTQLMSHRENNQGTLTSLPVTHTKHVINNPSRPANKPVMSHKENNQGTLTSLPIRHTKNVINNSSRPANKLVMSHKENNQGTLTSLPITHTKNVINSSSRHVALWGSSVLDKSLAIPTPEVIVLHNDDDDDDLDDSMVCATQDDFVPKSVHDPLQLRRSVPPFTETENEQRLRTLYEGYAEIKNPKEAIAMHPSSGHPLIEIKNQEHSKKTNENSKKMDPGKSAIQRVISPHYNNMESSFVFKANEEIVMASDESDEFKTSPLTAVFKCFNKREQLSDGDVVLILDCSDPSPQNEATSPNTSSQKNVFECMEQQRIPSVEQSYGKIKTEIPVHEKESSKAAETSSTSSEQGAICSLEVPKTSNSSTSVENSAVCSLDVPKVCNSFSSVERSRVCSLEVPKVCNSPSSVERSRVCSLEVPKVCNSFSSVEQSAVGLDVPKLCNSPYSVERSGVCSLEVPTVNNSSSSVEQSSVNILDAPKVSNSKMLEVADGNHCDARLKQITSLKLTCISEDDSLTSKKDKNIDIYEKSNNEMQENSPNDGNLQLGSNDRTKELQSSSQRPQEVNNSSQRPQEVQSSSQSSQEVNNSSQSPQEVQSCSQASLNVKRKRKKSTVTASTLKEFDLTFDVSISDSQLVRNICTPDLDSSPTNRTSLPLKSKSSNGSSDVARNTVGSFKDTGHHSTKKNQSGLGQNESNVVQPLNRGGSPSLYSSNDNPKLVIPSQDSLNSPIVNKHISKLHNHDEFMMEFSSQDELPRIGSTLGQMSDSVGLPKALVQRTNKHISRLRNKNVMEFSSEDELPSLGVDLGCAVDYIEQEQPESTSVILISPASSKETNYSSNDRNTKDLSKRESCLQKSFCSRITLPANEFTNACSNQKIAGLSRKGQSCHQITSTSKTSSVVNETGTSNSNRRTSNENVSKSLKNLQSSSTISRNSKTFALPSQIKTSLVVNETGSSNSNRRTLNGNVSKSLQNLQSRSTNSLPSQTVNSNVNTSQIVLNVDSSKGEHSNEQQQPEVLEEEKENSPDDSTTVDSSIKGSTINVTNFYAKRTVGHARGINYLPQTKTFAQAKRALAKPRCNDGSEERHGLNHERTRDHNDTGSVGTKRKRSQEDICNVKKANVVNNELKRGHINTDDVYSQHVMYSQQEPLLLEESFSDDISSQESNVNLSSSPVLIPSPGVGPNHERIEKHSNCSCERDDLSGSFEDAHQSPKSSLTSSKKSEKSPQQGNLSISLSLPSYQVPKHSSQQNGKLIAAEKKTTPLKSKKTPVITISSDSDDDGFSWFTSKSWKTG